MAGIVATAEIDIAAEPSQVWAALTDPRQIERYLFGARVETEWREGGPITWTGTYEGRPYTDTGEVVEVKPGRRLTVTHFSPLSGQEDRPENYHTLTYELDQRADGTHVSLSQDNNASEDEAEHSRSNWQLMLTGLKEVVERG